MKLFVDHYASLLNDKEEATNNLDDTMPPNIDNKTPLDYPFTHKEIKEAIRELKCNKSAGVDLVINEFIKASCNILTPTLTNLFNKIQSNKQEHENCRSVCFTWDCLANQSHSHKKCNKQSTSMGGVCLLLQNLRALGCIKRKT